MSSSLLKVVRSLSFTPLGDDPLSGLNTADWRKLLRLTDRSQLTLPLGIRRARSLPPEIRPRIERDLRNNALRHERTVEAYKEAQAALTSRGVPFVVLKGFTQWPYYCDDLRARPQYDLDLYCPESDIDAAYSAIRDLGYQPFRQSSNAPLDHLSPLIRKTGWRSRDDYYDPDLPLTIELHFRFWDPATERFDVLKADTFWERRCVREIAGMPIPVLNPTDALSYTSWHLVRHLLRGDLRAYNVYEMAHFLQRTATHEEFWREWQAQRRSVIPEAIAFRMAMDWFGCRPHPLVADLARSLPAAIDRWFSTFGLSPLRALQHPNKDELFLHFALVHQLSDCVKIARRRLFPFRFNPVLIDAHVPSPDIRLRWKRRVLGPWFMGKRIIYHLRALLPLIPIALRWWLSLSSRRTPRVGTVPP